MSRSRIIAKFLQSRGISGPWQIEGTSRGDFRGAVVVPALGEGDCLFDTLQSLDGNPPDPLSQFLVLVVVNHREDALREDRNLNTDTLSRLKNERDEFVSLNLAWVDAASLGRELPLKGGGVGLARKIGFDLALGRLDYGCGSSILVSLDADTLVRSDYLPAILRHFEKTEAGGAVIPYCHQKGKTPEEDRAIQRYELFLRTYVLGLSLAGSPYAFHTIGSTMACRGAAYARMGGMNRRLAGEDFYFLQQLAKTTGVEAVKGTVVYPSGRCSHRVPFGTGRSMSKLLAGERDAVLFYRPECFKILNRWLDMVSARTEAEGNELLSQAGALSPFLASYLESVRFGKVWSRLKQNHRRREAVLKAFNEWFDALKTMKLIHHLCDGPYPRTEPQEAVPQLLQWAGLPAVTGVEKQLSILRELQIGKDY